jgi:hypothetical protein
MSRLAVLGKKLVKTGGDAKRPAVQSALTQDRLITYFFVSA